jgi:hypothetical protein
MTESDPPSGRPVQLPAIIQPTALTATTDAELYLVPALIADVGDAAGWRYVEFFTANIRNPNTRRAYARACSRFFAWCDDRGLTLTTIRPFDVATYIETLQQTHSAPGVNILWRVGHTGDGVDRTTRSPTYNDAVYATAGHFGTSGRGLATPSTPSESKSPAGTNGKNSGAAQSPPRGPQV